MTFPGWLAATGDLDLLVEQVEWQRCRILDLEGDNAELLLDLADAHKAADKAHDRASSLSAERDSLRAQVAAYRGRRD